MGKPRSGSMVRFESTGGYGGTEFLSLKLGRAGVEETRLDLCHNYNTWMNTDYF